MVSKEINVRNNSSLKRLSVEDHPAEKEGGLAHIAEEGGSSLEKEGCLGSRGLWGETEAGGGATVPSAYRGDRKACAGAWGLGTSGSPAADRGADVRKAAVEVWF